MREAVRLNKSTWLNQLAQNDKKFAVLLVYQDNKLPIYSAITFAINNLFEGLLEKATLN
jgi:hypothetical protein